MSLSIRSALLLVFLLWSLLSSTGISIAGEYQVSRVIDGDTFIVKHGRLATKSGWHVTTHDPIVI